MLKNFDPQKEKYHKFYFELAELAAKQSVAVRRKVGAVFVLPTGLISTGWNGMPSGMDNGCEYECEKTNHVYLPNLETRPEVLHAEVNALFKLGRQNICARGAIVFVTTVPCLICAEYLVKARVKEVYFKDVQSNNAGPDHLRAAGIKVTRF